MRLFSASRFLVVLPLCLLGVQTFAQELTLFEPVEAQVSSAGSFGQQAEQRNLPNAPAFTLVGTSRFGSKLKAKLLANNGELIDVVMTDAESTPIPGRPGYRLQSVGSREVTVIFPPSAPCVGASDQGVSCSSNELGKLALTTAAPVVIASTEAATAEDGAPQEGTEEQAENPFAAALRAAAQNEAAARGRGGRPVNGERFEVQRIAPEDVPPGKRLVRTPFGDRLVDL